MFSVTKPIIILLGHWAKNVNRPSPSIANFKDGVGEKTEKKKVRDVAISKLGTMFSYRSHRMGQTGFLPRAL